MDPLPVVWTRFGLASDSGPTCVYWNNGSIFGPAPRCLDSLWTRFGLGFDYVYHNNCSVLDPLPVWPIYYYRVGERRVQTGVQTGHISATLYWAPVVPNGPLGPCVSKMILSIWQYLLFVEPGALAFLNFWAPPV